VSETSANPKPCVHPADRIADADRRLIDAQEFDDVDHSALNHGFLSYDDALRKCVEDGWDEAIFGPNFASTALVALLNEELQSDLEVIDKTPMLPRGHEGNYSVLPLVGYQLNKMSQEDTSKAFFLMRTKANTPAFLCGMMAGHVAERRGDYDAAKEHVRNSTTPAGILVHNGKQMIIPTIVVQGSEQIAVNMLCSMMDNDPAKFCCSYCGDTFIKSNGIGWGTSGFLAFECDHVFHPWCIAKHYMAGNRDCFICHRPLPDMRLENSPPCGTCETVGRDEDCPSPAHNMETAVLVSSS
tara:strand:+ start:23028 stop:23921 length:894 start_codon:yes stop_codon:yes gene_type:complete